MRDLIRREDSGSNEVCEVPAIRELEAPAEKKRKFDRHVNRKAFILLRETLSDEDFLEYVANGSLIVQGKYGTYEIFNTFQVTLSHEVTFGGKRRPVKWGLCVSVERALPEGDRILSLYLSITKDEENFVKTANFRNVSTHDEYLEASPETSCGESPCIERREE